MSKGGGSYGDDDCDACDGCDDAGDGFEHADGDGVHAVGVHDDGDDVCDDGVNVSHGDIDNDGDDYCDDAETSGSAGQPLDTDVISLEPWY